LLPRENDLADADLIHGSAHHPALAGALRHRWCIWRAARSRTRAGGALARLPSS